MPDGPSSEILALNARTELLPAQRSLTGADAGECTAIAVSPAASATGETLLAQNWDWVGSQREALILLRVREGSGRDDAGLPDADRGRHAGQDRAATRRASACA